jgi:hypothetical protein
MKNHAKILWLTETALMLALLVAVQGATAGLGNQFVTGSCVNLILAVTALVVGAWGGAVVATISPFLAFLFGIGPKFIQLLPGIAAGNLVLVLVLSLVIRGSNVPLWRRCLGWLAAAAAKFAVLYLVMVQFLVPTLVDGGVIPGKASAVLSAQFSWPQLITALIGGGVAVLLAPTLRKALNK